MCLFSLHKICVLKAWVRFLAHEYIRKQRIDVQSSNSYCKYYPWSEIFQATN